MAAFTNREQEKAKIKLRNKFENLYLNITSNNQSEQQTSISTVTEIMQNLFFEAMSVPFERLFSDTGNLITPNIHD
ncbi:1692_t:CDS:2 [Dentiscutata heterogama]|uniref:1692_t:CDS:1 n=1 Tax=Dentiscutata heterogama TaxID=1316150 RepID=A0ACA9LS19_9GLOM|nr:1692_t:CDS:2 [Dentiscutata heterogama]